MKRHTMDLNHLIEAIPDPLIVIDNAEMIHLVNAATESLFGYSREFLTGKTINLILPKREHKHFSCYYMEHLKKPTTVLETKIELTGLTKNKTKFPIAVYCSSLQQQKLALLTIKDLSQHIQLCDKKEELEESNCVTDQFLATMNHQLRTPLNAVLGFSEILLLKLTGDLTPEQEKHISIIHKSGKHLLALINDLSDLVKINSGEVSFCIENLNARELILDVMQTLSPLAEKKNLLFTGKLPNNPIFLKSDKRLLTQIITNIINNALKFTDQGSVFVELTEDKEHAFIQVIDTGIGIKEEKIERLFQAFQQLFIAEKKSEGSGLGLHISKKLADLIHVKFEVLSHYGKGTQFTIIVPKV